MTAALPAQAGEYNNKSWTGKKKIARTLARSYAFEEKTPLCKLQERGLHLTLTIQTSSLRREGEDSFIGEQE